MGFMHIRTSLSNRELLRQIKVAICENRRQTLFTRIESIAGSDNPYSLTQVIGPGPVISKNGASVYVTSCVAVTVEPRSHPNCTQELRVYKNDTPMFVDPITLVLKSVGSIVQCNSIAPPRYFIAGRWFCAYPDLLECQAPSLFPIEPLGIADRSDDELHGLGRSIYSKEQIEQFLIYQEVSGSRAAFLSAQTQIAFKNRNANGEWGLPFNQFQSDQILDSVGLSFIPLYRFFGPITVTILMVLFVVGIARILITITIRIMSLVRAYGCGPWLLAGFYGAVFQFLMTPLNWADSLAKEVAERMEKKW